MDKNPFCTMYKCKSVFGPDKNSWTIMCFPYVSVSVFVYVCVSVDLLLKCVCDFF